MTAVGYVGGDPDKLDRTGYALGDLLAADGTGTLVPVPLGVPTEVLTVDPAEPTDLGYQPGGGGGVTVVLQETTAPAPIPNALTLYAYDLGDQTTLRVMSPAGIPVTVLRDQIFVARNVTGAAINRGTPVYVSGVFPGLENIPEVAPARANVAATMPCVAVAAETLPNNGYGYVMSIGRLNDINTVAFAAGAMLYVSAAAAGQLTDVKPAHPNLQQPVAIVLRSHATLGSLAITATTPAGTDLGTRNNDFRVGDAAAGAKTLTFVNANTLALSANPTAARTLNLPDATGMLALAIQVADSGPQTGGNVAVAAGLPYTALGADIVIPAVAGDILGVTIEALTGASGQAKIFDAATRVAAADNRYVSSGTATPLFAGARPGWYVDTSEQFHMVAAEVRYVVNADDVVAGEVTLRPYCAGDGGAGTVLRNASFPVRFWAINYGQG